MNKKLVIFELNECDFSYFIYGAKRFKFLKLKNFLKIKKLQSHLQKIK